MHRSSLSVRRSMAAYMFSSVASAWIELPLTCRVASAFCRSFSTVRTQCTSITCSKCRPIRSSFFSTYPRRAGVTSTWWPVTLSCIAVSFSGVGADIISITIDSHLAQARAPALVGGRNAHRLAVFRDGAACDGNAFRREQLGDAAIAQRRFRLLVLDQLPDLGADGRGGSAGPVRAFDVTREKVAQLEDAARGVHVLAGGDAGNGRLVHADGFGDVLEDHRPHVLLAVLEERGLTLDDRAGDLDQRLVPDLQALQQPACFLQLRTHGRVAGVATDEVRIALVETHTRQGGRVHFYRPAVLRPSHEYVGNDVLRGARAHRRARPRMAGTYQRQRAGELLVAGPQLPFHDGELTPGNALEMMSGDLEGGIEAGRRRIELPQ